MVGISYGLPACAPSGLPAAVYVAATQRLRSSIWTYLLSMTVVRMILNMHSPPGGYQSNEYKGSFWKSPQMQQDLIDLWVQAAATLKNAHSSPPLT